MPRRVSKRRTKSRRSNKVSRRRNTRRSNVSKRRNTRRRNVSKRRNTREQWARARQGGQAGGMSAPEYREMEIAKAEEAARMRKEAVANLNAVLDDSGATVESVAAAIAGAGEDELAYREPELLNRAQGKLLELKEAAGKKGKGRFWRAKSG